jgi:EmrB/QacA subfamily drug resistance transporter
MTLEAQRNRWKALVVLCVGMLMIILDSTIVNVALPSIQGDLGFSQASLAWVVNAYLIAFGGLLLLAGRIGDLVGSRRIFLAGLTVFTLASLLCGVAQSQEMLIAARFVQGVGGALTSAVILGMIVTMFPLPVEQAKAIGIYSFVASAGASLGLLLGGAITQWINWHWIFFVNLPIGIATAIAARRLVEDQRGVGIGRGADALGAALVTSALMLLVYTILEAGGQGWGSLRTLGFGAAGIALLAAFVVRQRHAVNPLISLGIFRSRNLSGANVVQMFMVAGLFGMFFLGVLYLQQLLHYDAIETGLAFLPVAALIAVLSLFASARLNMRFGERSVLLAGLGFGLGGLVLFARAPLDATYLRDILPAVVLLGIGAGLSFPSLTTLAMRGVQPGEAGLASGLINTSLQVGGALGLAVLASLSATRTESVLADGGSGAAATLAGYHFAFWIAAGIAAAAIVVALLVLRSGATQAAPAEERMAEALLESA